jgi:hypothetical protein
MSANQEVTYQRCMFLMQYEDFVPDLAQMGFHGYARFRWQLQDFTATKVPYVLRIKHGDSWVPPGPELLPYFHRSGANGAPEIVDLGRMYVDKFLPTWWSLKVKQAVVRRPCPEEYSSAAQSLTVVLLRHLIRINPEEGSDLVKLESWKRTFQPKMKRKPFAPCSLRRPSNLNFMAAM